MRIKLLVDLPVESIHEMTAGRELAVVGRVSSERRGYSGCWVVGAAGERVFVLSGEYEILAEAPAELLDALN